MHEAASGREVAVLDAIVSITMPNHCSLKVLPREDQS